MCFAHHLVLLIQAQESWIFQSTALIIAETLNSLLLNKLMFIGLLLSVAQRLKKQEFSWLELVWDKTKKTFFKRQEFTKLMILSKLKLKICYGLSQNT